MGNQTDPIAVAIVAELERRGMTQKELAERAGTSLPTVNRWLQGVRGIKLAVRTAVLDVLELEVVTRRRRDR